MFKLFGKKQIAFGDIPDLINHHISRPDPIELNYTIR